MWPWEHAIVGYVAYSLYCHASYRESPGGLEAVAVVVASALPDLIDKPMAWEYGVFESGYALGHSIFFAVPLAVLVGLLARTVGRRRAGIAFGVGYLLHLPADVLDAYVREGVLRVELLLWPAVTPGGDQPQDGLLETVTTLFAGYHEELVSGDPSTYLLALFGLTICTAIIWIYDGAPPLPAALDVSRGWVRRAGRRLVERVP